MNEKLLREYVQTLLYENKSEEITYNADWADYLERFAMLGSIGQTTGEIGDWGESFAEKFFLKGYANTNVLYNDHNFPLSDLISLPITKDKLHEINFFDIKASATKKKKAASMSKTNSSIVKLINYNKNNNNFAEMFRQKIEESPQNFITINVGLIAFDYMGRDREDVLRVQIYGPRKVKIASKTVNGTTKQVLIDEVPQTLSGNNAEIFYGQPETHFSLLSPDGEDQQRRKKFLKTRDELITKMRLLTINDLERLSQDILCTDDDLKTKCDYLSYKE